MPLHTTSVEENNHRPFQSALLSVVGVSITKNGYRKARSRSRAPTRIRLCSDVRERRPIPDISEGSGGPRLSDQYPFYARGTRIHNRRTRVVGARLAHSKG